MKFERLIHTTYCTVLIQPASITAPAGGGCLILGLIYYSNCRLSDSLVLGGSDNGKLELVLVSSNWLTLLLQYDVVMLLYVLSCLFPTPRIPWFPHHTFFPSTVATENKSICRLPIIINLLKFVVLSSLRGQGSEH